MESMLGGGLFVAVTLVLPATAALFTVRADRRVRAATGPVRAALAAVLVALLALALGALLGRGPVPATVIALCLGASVLAWAPAARHWATRGLVAWALSIDAAVLYLAYVVHWTVTADIGAVGVLGSALLIMLEAFVLLIGAGYLWELVDVLARRTWSSYVDTAGPPPAGPRPFVSIHVPTHNEPPDLVIATVEALLRMEYDDYEVLVVDNNTDDDALWQPVAAWCEGRDRVRFLHLADWPGFKSGALNEALRVSDPRAEVIGIVDADYIVEPDFLARCAPLFAEPDVSFVQTPQDYRDWEAAPYFRRLYHSYGYFFDVSQRSRNERNGAIFGGTMGLIRRSALEAVGGWDEWCITEDAELSLRLLRAGGRGLHVDQTFGRGIMPLTFEALKRQRFRWCFGGIQILRMHWRSLLPGRRTETNRLTLGQRWAYLAGGLQWFGDLASLLFTGFLLVGALDAVFGTGVVIRRLSGLLLACVLVLVVLGAVRSLALLRRTSGASWGESLGAFLLWLALGWTVALAAFRGLFARQGVFLRTPKVKGELDWRDAVRGNRAELTLSVVGLVVAAAAFAQRELGAAVVALLLAMQAGGYLAAPVNSIAAIRSDLPEELRRRRRQMLASWGAPSARRGGLVLVATAGVLVALVAVAGPVGSPSLPSIAEELAEDLDQERDRPVVEEAEDLEQSDGTQDATTATAGQATVSPVGVTSSLPTRGPTTRAPAPDPTDPPTAPPSSTPPGTAAPTPPAPTTPPSGPPTTPTQKNTPTSKPTEKPSGQPTDKPSNAPTAPGPSATPGGGKP